jgi:diadenosine tetraphosphate (Ap4A) HIT family hydrolase
LLGELCLKESKLRFTKSRNNSDSEYKQFGHLIVAQRDGINVGEYAGQSVFHCHMHLIPRYKGDVPNPKGGVRGVIPSKQKY